MLQYDPDHRLFTPGGAIPPYLLFALQSLYIISACCFRSCAALAIKAVEVADRVVANDITQGGIGVVTPEVDQLLQVTAESMAFYSTQGSVPELHSM